MKWTMISAFVLKCNLSKVKDISVRYLSCFKSSVVGDQHRSVLITIKHVDYCCSCLESNTASTVKDGVPGAKFIVVTIAAES